MLAVGRERRRQDEPARGAARRYPGLLAAHPRATRSSCGSAPTPARIELAGDAAATCRWRSRSRCGPATAKRATLNGAPLRAAEQLRAELATLVFTPDRLVVVKGGPAARRAYFDRVLGRLLPPAQGLRPSTAPPRQRNAALAGSRSELSSRDALGPWTQRVAELGGALVTARHESIAALVPPFAERAAELGLAAAELAVQR